VLLKELRELLRCKRFPFRIENHNAIGIAERGQNLLRLCPHPTLRLLHFDDIQWQEVFDPGSIIRTQLRDVGILRLSDPENPQPHLFQTVLLPFFEESLAADTEDLRGLDLLPMRLPQDFGNVVSFDVFKRRHLGCR